MREEREPENESEETNVIDAEIVEVLADAGGGFREVIGAGEGTAV